MARWERGAGRHDDAPRRPAAVEPRLQEREDQLGRGPREDEPRRTPPPAAREEVDRCDHPQRDRHDAASNDAQELEHPGERRDADVIDRVVHLLVEAPDERECGQWGSGRRVPPHREQHEAQRAEQPERVPEGSAVVAQHRPAILRTAAHPPRRA